MAEGVVTADGKPLDLEAARDQIDRDFAAAMAEPAGDEKAPPKRVPREPAEPAKDKPRVSAGGTAKPSKGKARVTASALPVVSHADRVQAVQGLVQLAAFGCVAVSQRVQVRDKHGVALPNGIKTQTALQADAVTLTINSEPLAEAVAVTADKDARIAALVDKIAVAGPYAALITAVFGVGTQIARNHGVPIPGTADPEGLIKAATEVSAPANAR